MSTSTNRAAYEALANGTSEPLVALIDPQMEWRAPPPATLLATAARCEKHVLGRP